MIDLPQDFRVGERIQVENDQWAEMNGMRGEVIEKKQNNKFKIRFPDGKKEVISRDVLIPYVRVSPPSFLSGVVVHRLPIATNS